MINNIEKQRLVEFANDVGLVFRGGFTVKQEDNVPPISPKIPARFLVLFGNVGSSLWSNFSRSGEYRQKVSHPLNQWSIRIGNEMAEKLNGLALFPFGGPPHRPFLKWAKQAEGLLSSQLGIFIHPTYGLWHAYRFAIVLPESPLLVEDMSSQSLLDICTNCEEKPCLQGCPVKAFDGQSYNVDACYKYLDSGLGSHCMSVGCAARQACPVGAEYQYQSDHQQFHMQAFLKSRGRP